MKKYDYQKAKHIINESKDCLKSASLGMHEDWFWTAETIFEDGQFKKELPDNADELEAAFIEARKNGLSMFLEGKDENGLPKLNPEYEKYQTHKIGGLYGSDWATPTLQLIYKDGDEKMIACYKYEGDELMTEEDIQAKSQFVASGCLSSEVQKNIAPLEG